MEKRSLFSKLLCVLDAFLKLLESYYVILRWFNIRGSFFFYFKYLFRGRKLSRPWRDFTGTSAMVLNQKAYLRQLG
jgi:hypothetical protein